METKNRREQFLASIAGKGTAPNPLTREEKLLKDIADKVAEGGGSDLPDVFVVPFTGTVIDPATMAISWSCDVTYDQIISAINSGRIVRAEADITGLGSSFTYNYSSNGANKIGFTTITIVNDVLCYCVVGYNESGDVFGQIIPIAVAD